MARQKDRRTNGEKASSRGSKAARNAQTKHKDDVDVSAVQITSFDSNRIQMNWATIVMAIATCVMAAVSVLQWSILEKSLRADQRPWVTIQALPSTPVILSMSENTGLRFGIQFSLENVGKTPATNAWIDSEAFLGWDKLTYAQAQTKAQKLCILEPGQGKFGHVIQPNEILKKEWFASIPRIEIQKTIDDRADILPTIVACVTYTEGYGTETNRTIFVATLGRSTELVRGAGHAH